MYEFFSPEVRVDIGNYSFEKDISLQVALDDDKSCDWAVVTLSEKLLSKVNISKELPVKIYLGYQGNLEEILAGEVIGIRDNEIHIRNAFIKLMRTKITQNFVRCTPQEVVSFVLNQAGIEQSELGTEPYPMMKLLSVRQQTGLDVLKYVDQKWSLNNSYYYFEGSLFKWNVKEDTSKVYSFIYGENIIDLQNICPKTWELTTISVPQLKVRKYIEVQHPKINGMYQIKKLMFEVNESGFIRTKITFKE